MRGLSVRECVANITELLHVGEYTELLYVWGIYVLKGQCAAEGYIHQAEKQVS